MKDVNPNETQYSSNLKRFHPHIVIPAALMVITYVAVVNSPTLTVPINIAFAQSQPNIKASSIYQTHTMVLGNNIKNLLILIPDEAHESMNQPKNQLPLINQPYVPQNAVVNVGTTVTWFHADVDHKHTITLNDKSSGNN
ncbi:MAG: hypothetical protein WBP64_06675, partial [Nitrososphaeraceae archaeon]